MTRVSRGRRWRYPAAVQAQPYQVVALHSKTTQWRGEGFAPPQQPRLHRRCDHGVRASGKCAVVLGVTPQLGTALVRTEAIVAEGQRKRRPTAGIRGLVVARIDCPGEGIEGQSDLRRSAAILHRNQYRDGGRYGVAGAARKRAGVLHPAPELRCRSCRRGSGSRRRAA